MKNWLEQKRNSFRKQILISFLIFYSIVAANNTSPEGFASMNVLGQEGTTGGAGGNVVTVTTANDFVSQIWSSDTLIVQVADTIYLSSMAGVNSHKTIIGIEDKGVIIGGGLHISGKSNIIIQNLLFENSMDDAINVQESSHHIWINHCDLTNAYDGLIDIKRGSEYITVSWNKFYNHSKTCLLGHSDNNAAQDSTHLLVTYHHNWFNGTNSRHPRVRFSGLTHVYNNYYNNNSYGIASTMHANVFVENNYFYMVIDPTLVGYGSSLPGLLEQTGNVFDNCAHAPEDSGTVPFPPYIYQLDDAALVPAIVQASAGRIGFISGIKDDADIIADSYKLYQNYPNPFNPTTTIEYTISKPSKVKMYVSNILGQEVLKLVDGYVGKGRHHVLVDASQLSSGIYYYSLQVNNTSQVKKMILMK
jgi:pectate lyase